jgi:hypothetical protein
MQEVIAGEFGKQLIDRANQEAKSKGERGRTRSRVKKVNNRQKGE